MHRKAMRARPRGFSLIELLIVVAIILVIAAIAVPRFLRSKMMANETATASAVRSIATAQVAYLSTYQQGYAPSLAALGPPAGGGQPSAAAADLIDPQLATGTRGGYNFIYTPIDSDGNGQPDAFTLNANPTVPGQTGDKFFFVDQTSVVRFNVGAPANASSTPIPSS